MPFPQTAGAAAIPRPLAGLRIIDVSNVLAGPLGTFFLATLGAEIIKVERPQGGDLSRKMGADPARSRAFMGASYIATGAGKRSVTLNLQSPKGQEIFRKLVATSDAVFENFRPGTMEKLGLSYEHLRVVKPDLVYCAVSGFGQTGPLAMRPAYDQIIQGLSGLMSLTGAETPTPTRAGFSVSDCFAGAVAALATVAAIFRARATGIGGMVDVSMLESTMVMASWIVSDFLNAGATPTRLGNDSRSAAPSGTFATQDGHINIVCNEDRQFFALCDALELPELKQSPIWSNRHERFVRTAELKAMLHEVLTQKTSAEWDEILARHGVPCGRILTVPEVLDLPHLHARGFQQSCASTDIRVTGPGFQFAGETQDPLSAPPQLGQDNLAVYGELGYDATALAEIHAEKII